MIKGIDISHHQLPGTINWTAAADQIDFVIARASYGAGTPGEPSDRHFTEHIERARAVGLKIGAYHFYRQIHGVEEQLANFDRQLRTIGGLQHGDILPVLDMEDNRKFDGYPKAQLFSEACLRIATAMIEEYGGVILYYSSYFPEYLKSHKTWMRSLPQIKHWLADYNRSAGQPRTPYSPTWHLHQYKPEPAPFYSGGNIDQNVLNPVFSLDDLLIKPLDAAVTNGGASDEAHRGEYDTSERPGGALDEDHVVEGLALATEGAQKLADGLKRMGDG